jgi:hypothetical protein
VFASVDRVVVWEAPGGSTYHETVECAVRSDGSSPAGRWLDEMERGARTEDPNHNPPEDPEQIHDYWKMLAKVEHLAVHGEPCYRSDVRHLESGVWEFRHGIRRVSYWDTPGDGAYSPKTPVTDIRSLPEDRRSGNWWYPNMDVILRLGCAWDKDGRFAPPEKIAEALDIREEDAGHDCAK